MPAFCILGLCERFCLATIGAMHFSVCTTSVVHTFLILGGKKMFENVGEKIRNYAKGLFIVQVVMYIIGGIVMVAVSDGEAGLIIAGLVMLLLGWVIAWLNSVFIYGFGELIVKTTEIERNTRGIQKQSNETIIDSVTEKEETNEEEVPKKIEHRWRCSDCGNLISKTPCPFCAKKQKGIPYWCMKCNYEGPYGDICPVCGSTLKVYNSEEQL